MKPFLTGPVKRYYLRLVIKTIRFKTQELSPKAHIVELSPVMICKGFHKLRCPVRWQLSYELVLLSHIWLEFRSKYFTSKIGLREEDAIFSVVIISMSALLV